MRPLKCIWNETLTSPITGSKHEYGNLPPRASLVMKASMGRVAHGVGGCVVAATFSAHPNEEITRDDDMALFRRRWDVCVLRLGPLIVPSPLSNGDLATSWLSRSPEQAILEWVAHRAALLSAFCTAHAFACTACPVTYRSLDKAVQK